MMPINDYIPTRLIAPSERPALPAAKPHPNRSRFFFVIFQFTRLFLGNAWLRLGGKKTARLREERTCRCLQRLGMLWIRIAQALVLRGAELRTSRGLRLLDLHDTGGTHPFGNVRQRVETELNQPLEQVFDIFEETPFAATTVFQLHRARLLKEQIWTAVKVQHPHAEAMFSHDLKLFRRITGVFKLFVGGKGMSWDGLYHELEDIKIRELNYYYEATALENLEKNLNSDPIYAPRVFRGYCRQRVLVMEFIQGALLSDVIAMRKTDPERLQEWLAGNDIDLEKVARRLFHSTYRQVFEHNFFHGDMHTGNIILLKESRAAVIECRSAGSLEIESLKKQKMFLRALAEGEYVTAAEIYFLMAAHLPRVDLNIVKEQLVRIWRVWETRTHIKALPYGEKSLAYMTGCVNSVVTDSHFTPLWSFTKLTFAWVHLDNVAAVLDPGLNYLKELRHYFQRAEQRENVERLVRLPARLASSLTALHEVPRRTAEYALFRETLLRRQARVAQGSASKLDAVISAGFSLVSFTLSVVSLFFLSVFAVRHMDVSLEPFLGPQLSWLAGRVPVMGGVAWAVLFTLLGGLYVFFRSQKKHFNRREFRGNEDTTFET